MRLRWPEADAGGSLNPHQWTTSHTQEEGFEEIFWVFASLFFFFNLGLVSVRKRRERICLVRQHPQKQAGSLDGEGGYDSGGMGRITSLAPHHHFRARVESMDIDSVLTSSYAAFSKPTAVVHWCAHRAAPLKPCFQLGLATIPTGSKGIIPTIFYFLFS